MKGPQYRPEPETPVTPDLFAVVLVTGEDSLLRRLQQAGADVYCADVYCAGEFPTLRERLRHVIRREQLATVVCGRNELDKVETYSQAFERVFQEPLVKKVPRGTKSNTTSEST